MQETRTFCNYVSLWKKRENKTCWRSRRKKKEEDGNLSYDSDSVFAIGPSSDRPTVKVAINGVKGRADADSCSTVNILDIDQYRILEKNSRIEMPLQPATNKVFSYAQHSPLELAGKFIGTVRSIITGREITAEFLVTKQKANSKPLLSFETSVAIGVLHVTHKISAPVTKENIIQRFPKVFTGIGSHNSIEAKFIVDDTVTPVVQKTRKIPYNLEKLVKKKKIGSLKQISLNQYQMISRQHGALIQ